MERGKTAVPGAAAGVQARQGRGGRAARRRRRVGNGRVSALGRRLAGPAGRKMRWAGCRGAAGSRRANAGGSMSPAVGAGQGWAAAGLDPARQRAAAAGKGGLCRQQMASAVFRLISPSGRPGSGDGNKEKAEKGTRCSRGIRRPGLCSAGRSGPARAGPDLRPGGVLRPGRAAWPRPGSRSRRGGGVQPAGRACGSTQSSAPAGRISAAAAAARQSSNACAVRRAAASVRRRRTVKAWPALCSAGQDCTAGRTGRTAGAWPWPAARQPAASAADKAAATTAACVSGGMSNLYNNGL